MRIKRDPITGLYCRSDGAVLLPPSGTRFRKFRWTFGSETSWGYRVIGYRHKYYLVHVLICRAFNGLAPEDKPEVDHIDRNPSNNASSNLRWVDRRENNDNKDYVDQALEKYGVRRCDDLKAYMKAYNAAHREEINAYQKAHREAHREEYKAYQKAYDTSHREERRARDAARRAQKKAQGLIWKKGPDGKWGWFPRLTPVKEVAPCM